MDEDFLLLNYFFIKTRRKRKALQLQELKKRHRNVWVRDIFKQREQYGLFHTLVRELELGDREYYFKYVHIIFFIKQI